MPRVQLSAPDNRYFTSYFDEELKLYEIVWHEESEKMDEEEYKALMLNDRDLLTQYYHKVNYIIINLVHRLHTMSPELQDWSSAHISPTFVNHLGVFKVAVVNSKDFSTQFSIEQALEEDNVTEEMVKIRYFDEEQEARSWLLGL
ncbi:hypothetical protein BKI52_13345 [marine bacterium AO1-C]|nr:hypothetical protein BKI52_13345 [marine bacterium AO1-C]